MKTKLYKTLSSFPTITFALLFGTLCSADIQINTGWNMLGVTTDTASGAFVANSNEVAYTYKSGTWNKYDSTNTGTIKAGSGFWLYSSSEKNTTVSASNNENLWVNGWNLVTPIDKTWDIKDNFPTVNYAWRWVDGVWKLYTKDGTNYGYTSFDGINLGEGVWVKSEHNGFLGNSPINVVDGAFEAITKTSNIASSQNELINNVKNNFDIILDKSNTLVPNFVIGIKMTKLSSGNYYYYVVDSAISKVQIGKYDLSSYLGTSNISKPTEFINGNTELKLNFNKIVDYLMNSYGYTLNEMNDRFSAKENYKMEIYISNISIKGGKNIPSPVTFQLSNTKSQTFNIGSSKIEGILTIK